MTLKRHLSFGMRVPNPAGVVLLASFLGAVLVATGCEQKKATKPAVIPPTPVTVSTAVQRDIPVTVSAVGSVTPYNNVQVKSMVTAQIEKVHFQQGDFVKKGQLLFTLDPRTFEATLAQVKGQLAKDEAAAENARTQATRYAALYKDGVVAREQYDQMRTAADQANATVIADKANVQSAKVNLDYTKVYSPIDGKTGDILVQVGNLIKANDLAMVVINQISPIYASFSIPESYLSDVKKYMAAGALRVEAQFPDSTQPPVEGKLFFVNNTVDTQTGTINLMAKYPNTDHRLWPGQYVNIVLTLTTRPKAVLVPMSAVQTGQNGPYVFVIDQKKTAEVRQVTLGPVVGNWQVLNSGVTAGETVVTDGQSRLNPGTSVEIKTDNADRSGVSSGATQQASMLREDSSAGSSGSR